MAANFLAFDQKQQQPRYFGELGEAHTVLNQNNTAGIINKSPRFKGKVPVINLYCYNCTTSQEPVSNWPLKKIEKLILEKLLPYCTSDFTLFDFNERSRLSAIFAPYGQFLIVAKDQH